jgi:hypothetical protein
MPDLEFQVERAEPEPFSVTPLLLFKLLVRQSEPVATPIHSIALRCQIRIEPARRRYVAAEQDRLRDLFDTPGRWGQTLHSMLWTHVSSVIPPFTDRTLVDLPVPCTFDFNVAALKYFSALEDGEVPLKLFFSGTIFHENAEGGLQVAQIPREKEAAFRLPVRVWQDMMELYYPDCAWLCLRRDLFDRLHDYKRRNGLPTCEQALENLLSPAQDRVSR